MAAHQKLVGVCGQFLLLQLSQRDVAAVLVRRLERLKVVQQLCSSSDQKQASERTLRFLVDALDHFLLLLLVLTQFQKANNTA